MRLVQRIGQDPQAVIAERALAARPGDPEALAFAVRARASAGDAEGALAMLANHPSARHRMSAALLDDTARELARCAPAHAIDCHLAFAREMVRRCEFEIARQALEQLPVAGLALREVRILRAQVLIRAGALSAARQELARVGGARDPEVVILRGIVDALAGRFVRARRGVLAMRIDDAEQPRLAGACAAAVGLSYFLEERFALALTWSRRARRSYIRHSPAPASALVNVLEFMALLSLDRTDQAIAFVIAQARALPPEVLDDPAVRGVDGLLRAAVLGRRGNLRDALALGDAAQQALHARGDHVARLIVLRYQGWAAIACGELDRAAGYLHECEGFVAASELGGVSVLCELELARLDRARGRSDDALARLARVRALAPRCPYAEVEQWALSGDRGPPPRADLEGMAGYAALRAAERALNEGQLAEGLAFATRAEAWYRDAVAAHEQAQAALLRAEALARAGDEVEARRALAACEPVAAANGYRLVHVAAAILQAHLADRSGAFAAYAWSLVEARRRAGNELWDPALDAAGRRVGLRPASRVASDAPFAALIARLALDRRCVRALVTADRLWLLADGDRGPELDVLLDVPASRVRAAQGSAPVSAPIQGQSLRLLASVIEAGPEGVSLERLYVDHWGGSYHPLRHRSTVYMAMSRLRAALRDIDPELIELVEGNYRIAWRLRAAVAYAMPAHDDDGRRVPAPIARWRRDVLAAAEANEAPADPAVTSVGRR